MKPTTDNNRGNFFVENSDHVKLLQQISGRSIDDLEKENPGLLVVKGQFKDDVQDSKIFSLINDNLHTENIVGFIGINDDSGNHVKLQIRSRFDKDNNNQYFFQYMLQRVFCPTILDLQIDHSKENLFEFFLAILFPHYLKSAFRQGLFKKYKWFHHNNPDVKGSVDIKRHIRQNIPFSGNIAYTTREYSFNNPVTQLIRHTINHLEKRNLLFDRTTEFRQAAQEIANYTPDFNSRNQVQILNQNRTRITHPYFNEYEPLRKICLKILRHEGVALAEENKTDKIYGVVFDCAWLWEEYLNTVLEGSGIKHSENKTGKNAIYLFKDKKSYPRYPDFYSEEKGLVLDAKYKHLEKDNNALSRDDIHQIISYMHVLMSETGAVIFPYQDSKTESDYKPVLIGKLKGHGGSVYKLAMKIPVSENFSDFVEWMNVNESKFIISLNEIINEK